MKHEPLSKTVHLSNGVLTIHVWQTAEREGKPNTIVSLSVGGTRVHSFNHVGKAPDVLEVVGHGLNTWNKLQSFLTSRLTILMQEANSLDVKRYYVNKQVNEINQLFQIG